MYLHTTFGGARFQDKVCRCFTACDKTEALPTEPSRLASKLNTVQIHFFSTELGDPDILHLSERITDRDELIKLGVDVLKLPDFKIKSALYDHRDSINSAAYAVLSEWRVQHQNRYQAYNTLMSSLAQHNMRLPSYSGRRTGR